MLDASIETNELLVLNADTAGVAASSCAALASSVPLLGQVSTRSKLLMMYLLLTYLLQT
jgi:hypothetical protein